MKKMIKKSTKFLWLLIAIVVLQACYPSDSIPITDLDTVTTVYNSDDLATAPTSAAILWEVVQVEAGDDSDIPYNKEVDDEILNTTLEELVSLYGADSVFIVWNDSIDTAPKPTPSITVREYAKSDLNIPNVESVYLASIILNEKTVGIVYPGYPWYPGWGGWYPGYPCYYCYYPPTVGYQKYEVGTIILDMYDLRVILGGSTIPDNPDPSWIAALRGLLSSKQTTNEQRTIAGVQKAFAQSPYLSPTSK